MNDITINQEPTITIDSLYREEVHMSDVCQECENYEIWAKHYGSQEDYEDAVFMTNLAYDEYSVALEHLCIAIESTQ